MRTVEHMPTRTVTAAPPSFLVHPIDRATADRLRATATIVITADVSPGYPCRRCRRDAEVGEEVVLVSFDPFEADVDSPYRCAGPIYLHVEDCSARLDTTPLPRQLTSRRLSVRAFDRATMIVDAAVIDGDDLGDTIERVFADPEVERVHVHNAGPGCFAALVTRR